MDNRCWLVAVLGTCGCGPAVAFDSGTDSATDTDTDTDPTVATDSATDTAMTVGPTVTTTPPPPLCPAVVLPAPPATIVGTSAAEVDKAVPSCSVGNGPDSLVEFTAPTDGVYVFDTSGSAIDTILYALDGDCTGPELACNDDSTDMTSAIAVPLAAGQLITLVVDTFGVPGDWQLSVTSGGSGLCPEEDLGPTPVPWTRSGTTVGGTMQLGSDCGGPDAPERAYQWVVPQTAIFTFETFDSGLDTVLSLNSGGDCSETVLACNGDVEFSAASGLVSSLNAGDTVTVVVDGVTGVGGDYVLTVDQVEPGCPKDDLGMLAPPFNVPASTAAETNSRGASCGGWFSADQSWRWTATDAGTYQISADANFPVVLHVMTGDCAEEVTCAAAPLQGFASVDVDVGAGESIVIQVDGQGHESGNVTVFVESTVCPDTDLGMVANVDTAGSTVGASDTLDPSCTPGGADVVFAWTAPATGLFDISTLGSDFDTVLAVFDGTCEGPELACDDDGAGGVQSLIQLAAVAGETYVILLDGFGGDAGDYQLTISPT